MRSSSFNSLRREEAPCRTKMLVIDGGCGQAYVLAAPGGSNSSSSGGKSIVKVQLTRSSGRVVVAKQGIVIIISKASQRCQAEAATTSTTTATGEIRGLVAAATVILLRQLRLRQIQHLMEKDHWWWMAFASYCALECAMAARIVHLRAPFEQGKCHLLWPGAFFHSFCNDWQQPL
jgi:hypothetical protein